ncbi:MAG: serine/threonine protein kinase [Pirellulaceae bacterium]|nr:serine/threonine protein kinase [Pirellulaceae bacterium]
MADTLARRVHELLTQSMDMPDERRRQFLSEACDDDPRLASHFERLLHAIDDSQSFLERPALETVAPDFWQEEPAMPQRIGGYRIVRQLGSGGMGTVYEAIQNQPQRPVAIKIPRRRLWNANMQQQVQYESEILGRLRHPNIAQKYEAGVDQNDSNSPLPFFAMEFVPNARTLIRYVRDETLSVEDTVRMLIQICDAVQHGHRLGIIHRDLKPANILVDAEGNPKVIDFGVASSRDNNEPTTGTPDDESIGEIDGNVADSHDSDRRRLSASPLRFGTMNYMSPEQLGDAEFLDARTDIFSLGVVMYQLLCDSLPFDLKGRTPTDALNVIQNAPIRVPTRQGKPLDQDLQAILDLALAVDREQRYSSMDAFGQDLSRYLNGFPISARSATPWYVGRKFTQRNPWLVGAGLLLLLAIAAGVIASSTFAYRTAQESKLRQIAESQAIAERDEAIWQNYIANVTAGFVALYNDDLAQVRMRLAAAPEQHRNWEWHFLAGNIDGRDRVVEAHSQMIQALAISDDGTLAATGAEDGRVRIWRTSDWQCVLDIPRPTKRGTPEVDPKVRVSAVAFRNGTKQIVSGMSDGSIRIWDAATGGLVRELVGHEQYIYTLSVHPNGTIASACFGGRGRLWDGESETATKEINDQQNRVQGAIFCDAGKKLLTWEPNGSIWLRNAEILEPITKFNHPGSLRRVATDETASLIAAGGTDNRVYLYRTNQTSEASEPTIIKIPGNRSSTDSLHLTPDGSVVTMGRVDRRIEAISTVDYSLVARLRGHDEFVSGVWMSSDQNKLISASGDGTIREWRLDHETLLGNVLVAPEQDQRWYDMDVSRKQGLIAAVGDRDVKVWDPKMLPRETPSLGNRGRNLAVAWSPCETALACGGDDQIVRIVDLKTQQVRELPKVHSRRIGALSYTPDGNFLVSGDFSGKLLLWNLDTGQLETELTDSAANLAHSASINRLVFSRDGRWLASASDDRTVAIWDIGERKLVKRLEGQHLSDVFAVVFSPSGDLIYTGSRDRTIAVWSLETGQVITTLVGHSLIIRCMDISPDGTRLVAGSWFGDVLLWDVSRRELVATFKAHDDIIHAIRFDATGNSLSTCSYDQSVRSHQIKTE